MQAVTHIDTLRDTIYESFADGPDGYVYPIENGMPLVRIYLASTSYQIERRRNVGSPWTPLVAADNAEFDPIAFRLWRERWPTVVA